MNNFLIIATSVELVRIAAAKIVYVSSDGNYSTVFQVDRESRLLTVQLGQIEKLIAEQLEVNASAFIRIGKCLIINRNYIYYINISKQSLILSDTELFRYHLSASKEALKKLKELVENNN